MEIIITQVGTIKAELTNQLFTLVQTYGEVKDKFNYYKAANHLSSPYSCGPLRPNYPNKNIKIRKKIHASLFKTEKTKALTFTKLMELTKLWPNIFSATLLP